MMGIPAVYTVDDWNARPFTSFVVYCVGALIQGGLFVAWGKLVKYLEGEEDTVKRNQTMKSDSDRNAML